VPCALATVDATMSAANVAATVAATRENRFMEASSNYGWNVRPATEIAARSVTESSGGS